MILELTYKALHDWIYRIGLKDIFHWKLGMQRNLEEKNIKFLKLKTTPPTICRQWSLY